MPSSAPERLVVVLGYSRGRKGELHPICAARLEHAAALAGENDVVLLSGWSRHPTALPEAELMRRAWPGATDALVVRPRRAGSPPRTRRTRPRMRASSASATSSSSRPGGTRPRAGILFRSLLPGVRVTVSRRAHSRAAAAAAARAGRLPARPVPARAARGAAPPSSAEQVPQTREEAAAGLEALDDGLLVGRQGLQVVQRTRRPRPACGQIPCTRSAGRWRFLSRTPRLRTRPLKMSAAGSPTISATRADSSPSDVTTVASFSRAFQET